MRRLNPKRRAFLLSAVRGTPFCVACASESATEMWRGEDVCWWCLADAIEALEAKP